MSNARRPIVIGHKGASAVAPENTLASFRAALEAGATAVECDIHATRDGVPVIIHDATVDRTTDGSGRIDAMTLAEVQALDASFGMEAFRGERIPTLDELLTLVAGRATISLEYKALDAVAPSVPILRKHDAMRWCTAWAFSADMLAEARRLMPELSRTQNVGRVESWDAVLAKARELESLGVSLSQDLVTPERVSAAKARGLIFYTWTANTPADWQRLIDCDVDAIVTDDP
ncbi:MAG TPA: glycerophosphodiester phosphodiesterase family protein, partial [Dehalococcoidia bacterium]